MARQITRQIELYSAIKSGILSYIETLAIEDNAKKKKSTASHRIAIALAKNFPHSFTIDIDYMGADIVIRKGSEIFAVILWSSDYLTEKDKDKALKLHKKESPILTLAFSPMEEKGYVLIYRFEKEYLEYLHINKADNSEKLLKRCLLEETETYDDKQLLLSLKSKKKPAGKKKSSPKEGKADKVIK